MTDLARMASALVLVLALVAGVLRGLDALPGWWTGVGRSGVRFESLDALERATGRRLLQPAYFPDALSWPAARVVLDRRPPPAAMLGFVRRGDGREAMRIWQALERETEPPGPVRLSGVSLSDVAVTLHDGEAQLRSLSVPDGQVWDELTLQRAGRWVVVHSTLPAEQTVRLADSLR